MNTQNPKIVVYRKKWDLLSTTFEILGILACCLFALVSFAEKSLPLPIEIAVFAILASAVLFFGGIWVVMVFELLSSKPILIVDSEGIHFNNTGGLGLLRWEQIQRVFLTKRMWQRLVCIVPTDSEIIQFHQGLFQRMVSTIGPARIEGVMAVCILQRDLPMSVEEFLTRVKELHGVQV